MAPAIRLAREGFVVSPLLSRTIHVVAREARRRSGAAALFLPDGEPLRPGDLLVQPVLAATLERIATEGADPASIAVPSPRDSRARCRRGAA